MTCGQSDREVGPISWRGNCETCGTRILVENIVGIATKQGYAYKRQVRGMRRYVELVLSPNSRHT